MEKKKIGDLLVEKGYVTAAQVEDALAEQTLTGRRLGEILVSRNALTEDQLVDVVSERLGIPKITLTAMVIDPEVIRRVPVGLARRYTLIPIFEIGATLTLAMADPLNIIAIDEIRYLTGKNIKRAIATPGEIKAAIDEFYSVADSLNQIIGAHAAPAGESGAPRPGADVESESAVVRMVNLMIERAAKDRASDIHIEPEENRLRIRYRINGAMREEAAPPKAMQNELISRIKIAANLDVSEKRLPQDGRFMMTVDKAAIDLRVSTLPTIHGEKIVIRLLDRRNLLLSFRQLGFGPTLETAWKTVIYRPEGLILISGPTSSGKTSTLYATLHEINSVEKNIITVEDPVEYSLPLIIQIQINEKAGLTFPTCLRAILRQNPDVIMIGEIRDPETARMAIRSALTGHTVFSTIHTNDAPSAIARLVDMDIERYLVASALKGVLAQRLVRVTCPECAAPYRPAESVLLQAGLRDRDSQFDFRKGVGCPKCKNTGFRGLTGIYEYVEVTPTIADMLMRNAPLNEIRESARRQGYVPLFEAGLEAVRAGRVCLEELLKETSNAEDYLRPGESASRRAVHAEPV
ncbi:MAG TPA: ATPase, T2SS/T4P/T4SS family [candidate division Zixibacteria bacterium]|nr:ATPase, T2SS/T4P/T4SS family [candidate division Zixibacteria bacterium]HPI31940.1 ATPase, T2SS/T4P/T4SS family [candidate division Zixibacteria bacterium]HPM37043.1 ATPase, T2SS/T4P/T4SS family [candidate division Zixibacteria bacterium]